MMASGGGMAISWQSSATAADQLSRYLTPGETLLWAGRPDPAVNFTAYDACLIPFSLLWSSFAVAFFIAALANMPGSGPGVLFGLPFLAVAGYLTVGRFFYKRSRKRRTAYGLTTSRAIVMVGASLQAEMTLWQRPISARRSRDRRHISVTFGQQPGFSLRMQNSYAANTGMELFTRRMRTPVAFYDVADPDHLEAVIGQLRTS
jgi:hypothetical protein